MDFTPLPWLGNPHVQTVLANLWRGPRLRAPVRQRLVTLPDGDQLVLHDSTPPNWQPGHPIALLVHGLGGSHDSGYMRRMVRRLLPHGFRAVRLDLRGCGRGALLSRRTYNAACSGDVRAVARTLLDEAPRSPLTLIGFSLGGNIVLKLAGEAAADPLPGLARVTALAPPIDLERCAALLSLPRNRFYELHFVRNLVKQVRRRERHFPDLSRTPFPRHMTMRLFDDLHTAPQGGFTGALDYYRRAGARPLVPHIAVPAFLLTARDDPFIAVEAFEDLKVPPHIEVHIAARGGHLGFLGNDGNGGIRWAERRMAEWVVSGEW
jgi:predicted alpha/beta-fold hydrolase